MKITNKQLKQVVIVIAMAFVAYPVYELSRCIITYNLIAGWDFTPMNSYLELLIIWIGYTLLPLLLNDALDCFYRRGQNAPHTS
ncbi:MAG: hypothetical protein PHG35_03380 [Dehalococcoidales bacterium]|jgi:hypothetical protein|nr:hypothetical protein [Dehalococcoidales bacterium]